MIEQATGTSLMVLVVDDDEQLCANLTDFTTDLGLRVNVANDGDKAAESAREESFDIMLIDLKLPPLDGLETYLTMREFRPDMVAIIISSHFADMGWLAQQVTENNALACLEKLIDLDQLIAILQRIERQEHDGAIRKTGVAACYVIG